MLKKVISILVAASILFTLSSSVIFSAEASSPASDFSYSVKDDGTAVIDEYLGDDALVIVPSEIDGHAVTEIGPNSFSNKSVEEVIIPDGVVEIGDMAFFHCLDLHTVELPESVMRIGNFAFVNCVSMLYLYIPRLTDEFGNYFYGFVYYYSEDAEDYVMENVVDMTMLVCKYSYGEEYAMRYGVNYIYSVYTCGEFEYVLDYSGNAEICGYIGDDAYVVIPETVHGFEVETIAEACFEGNDSIVWVVLPKTVKYIERSAFKGCKNLRNITLNDGIDLIGTEAFLDCTALHDVEVPVTVELFGEYCFGYETVSENIYDTCSDFELGVVRNSVAETLAGQEGLSYHYTDNAHELAAAQYAAKAVLDAAAGYDPSQIVQAEVNDAKIAVSSASTAQDVRDILEERLEVIKGQIISETYDIGDANLDGKIDIRDVTAIQRYVAEYVSLKGGELLIADVNGDKRVDINDATHLQRYLAEYNVILG